MAGVKSAFLFRDEVKIKTVLLCLFKYYNIITCCYSQSCKWADSSFTSERKLDFLTTTGGFFKHFWLQEPRKSEILKRKT